MYSVIGLSSGAGVILYPFYNNPNIDLKYAVECRRTYLLGGMPVQFELNFPDVPYSLDLGIPPESVDVVVGHPKCGMSSVFALSRGKKNTSHKDEPSLNLYIHGIHKLFPKYFLLENLPKLLDTYSKEAFGEIFSNYHLIFWEGSVSDFGNSQKTRKRLVIIGIRKDVVSKRSIRILSKPKPLYDIQTTGNLLMHLPEDGHFTEDLDEQITVYGGHKKYLWQLQKYWLDNKHLNRYKVGNDRMQYAPGVYINRADDYPKTIRKTNRQFNPDGIQMSPREMARIQGIPDTFKLCSPSRSCSYDEKTLINKGRLSVANTPPYEIGKWFQLCMDKLFRIKNK